VERWERLIWIAGRRRRVGRRHWASRDDWGIRASRKVFRGKLERQHACNNIERFHNFLYNDFVGRTVLDL